MAPQGIIIGALREIIVYTTQKKGAVSVKTAHKRREPIDLTQEPCWKVILLFSLPVILSYLLQQVYSISDAAIVGQTLTAAEVAGVNDTNSLVFIFLQFAFGVSAGFCVITSYYVGMHDERGVRRSLATQLLLSAALTVVLTALALALVMSLTLFACGRKAQDDKTDDSTRTEDATRVFTDSCGREVKVPADIQKVAVSGPLAQMVVFAIAPDKMVGVANAWDKTAENYFDQKYLDLPLLGQLYGGKGELNLETLLTADPDVVIDVGEPKSTMAEDLDGLQEQTGIPFVHIDAYLASMDDTYAMLSDLLAMPNEGQALADYCRNAYDTVKAIVDGVEKADVLYITGEEGLNVIARDSYHAEVIDMLCNNLAVVDEPSSKGTGNEVDMEQILNWDPSIVFFAPGSIYSTVADNENWQTIPAIKDGKYYEVPFGPYNWMGFPPSVQRILGMQWMAKVLYPEAADYDMYEVAQTYFQLFYHCDLTIDQYNALVDNSLPAVEAAG